MLPYSPSCPILNAQLLLDTHSTLGEGAIWNHEDQKLYWVDIEQKKLHWLTPLASAHHTVTFTKKITTVVPAKKEELILGMEDGIYSYTKSSGKLTLIKSNPENRSTGNRFNDGKCDPNGRLWIGTMGEHQSAALYRLDADHSLHTMQTGITNSNGILWSGDKKTMYYIDTPTYKVTAYDFNNETGQITNPQTVITVPEQMGYPDGATIDAEGMIWIALWGGYSVSRWNPKNGQLLLIIKVPSKNVTSCAFGGTDLDTLYITSASTQLTNSELTQYPNSGGLFSVKPGVKGIEANSFIS